MPTPREVYGAFNTAHCDADVPWGEEAARQRLAEVAAREGLTLEDPVLLGDGSNETWRVDDRVVRICWRGDLGRIGREAQLSEHLPWKAPAVDTVVVTDHLAYSVAPVWSGCSLGDLWPRIDRERRRMLSAEAARLAAGLHATTLPDAVHATFEAVRLNEGSSAVDITSRTAVPSTPAQVGTIAEYLHGLLFCDHDLVDRATAAATAAWAPPEWDEPVVLHGDLQPGNVIVTPDDKVVLIDLEYASLGPAEFDLANSAVWRHLYAMSTSEPEAFPRALAHPAALPDGRFAVLSFLLRGAAVWAPTTTAEQLPEAHPFRLLRHLLPNGDDRLNRL